MADVFISYAREDRNRVRLVALGLTAEGFAVWWDPSIRPGRKWNDAIRKALDGAAAVVTCWSPKSARSNWVIAESNHANSRNALVPVMVRNCTPPLPFNMIQTADLSRWRGNPDDPEWVATLEQVRRLVEAKRRLYAAAPPPGEAHGATGYGGRRGGLADEGVARYRVSSTRGRMGPRFSQLLLGTVVIGGVLTATLWGAENWEKFYRPPPPEAPEVAPPATTPAPIEPSLPPTEISDVQETPEPFEPAPPPREPDPAPPPPDRRPDRPDIDIPRIEACAARLAGMCPGAEGRTPLGFRANGRIDGAERRFLIALGVAEGRRIDASAVAELCQTRLSVRAAARQVRSACDAVSFPPQTDDRPPAQEPERPNDGAGDLGVFFGQVLEGLFRPRDDKPSPPPPPPPPPPRGGDDVHPGTPSTSIVGRTRLQSRAVIDPCTTEAGRANPRNHCPPPPPPPIR